MSTPESPQTLDTKKMANRVIYRNGVEAEIISCAERVFSECGYQGASVAAIAERAGLSKQNLLYYFPTKHALYKRVLDEVLDAWLENMRALAEDSSSPEEALRSYIAEKLRFSRERPYGSRVYGIEVMTGAQVYGAEIQEKLVPYLHKEIAAFERWIAAGKMAQVDVTHLLFTIWAMTQSYADFSTQMTLVMRGKKLGRKDFEIAENLITNMVLAAVGLPTDARQSIPV